jgi:hypothetical protein
MQRPAPAETIGRPQVDRLTPSMDNGSARAHRVVERFRGHYIVEDYSKKHHHDGNGQTAWDLSTVQEPWNRAFGS